MASRCFVGGTCLNPEINPHQGGHLNVLRGHILFPPPTSQAEPMKREQTSIDRQSQRFIIGTYSVRPRHRPTLSSPSGFSRRPWGLPTTRFPYAPRRCSSQKHAGGGLPLAPPLTKCLFQLEGGGERKTVLSFDVPPMKSLRGCGTGRGRRFAKINYVKN